MKISWRKIIQIMTVFLWLYGDVFCKKKRNKVIQYDVFIGYEVVKK